MSGRVSGLLGDRRARVPFALIGIFLLVTGSVFLVSLNTEEESTPKRETDRAMEQTDAATQTALTDALGQGVEKAAEQPLTQPARTPYGIVLAGSGDGFDQYVKALVYLEAKNRLETAGQVVGDVETRVSLPAISDRGDFAAALDRVTVNPGSETAGIESGTIEVEIEDVTTVATRNGEVISRETETVTVSVASPLYQLHDRTETFQDRLDASVTESGFSQRFNARIYALGWARGYAQYAGLPVTEVIANRHVVPSANDAVYRTQKDVFGTADPQLSNSIRRAWLCMGMQDAEALYGGYTESNIDVANDVCDASKWLFGEQATGKVPAAPGATDLLGEAPGMDAEHTIGVNATSKLPIRHLATGSGPKSIEDVIDRIFEVEVASDLSTETVRKARFNHNAPSGVLRSYVTDTETDDVSVSVAEITEPGTGDQYAVIEGTVQLDLTESKKHVFNEEGNREKKRTTATGTEHIDFEITLEEGQITPNAKIDQRSGAVPVADRYVYGAGPGNAEVNTERTIPTGVAGTGFENYGPIGPSALGAFFTENSERLSASDPDGSEQIEDHLENSWAAVTSASDLDVPSKKTIDVPQPSGLALERTILSDLAAIQAEAGEITYTFERRELLNDESETGPYGELINEVSEEKTAYLDRQEPYANVGQKAVYEARKVYFESLESTLAKLESAHGYAMDEIEKQIPDIGIDKILTYLQEGVTATPPDPVPLESSSLTDDISYQVSGSPTYLVTENVTSDDVPAVGNDVEAFAPMAVKNENYLKLPYESVVDSLIGQLTNVLGLGEPDAELTFQMAGEALSAGEKAADAAAADPEYGDESSLESLTADIEGAVDSAIAGFNREMAAQIGYHLYPDNTSIADKTIGEISVPEDCTDANCSFDRATMGDKARDDIRDAVESAVDDYDRSTAVTAEAIANGDISEAIVEAVAEKLDGEDLRPPYAEGLTVSEWETIVRSATHHAILSAVNEQSVTVSDTDTVEELDREIRQTLENVSAGIVAERFETRMGGKEFDISEYDDWVNGTRTPVRVPAGMPVLPLPNFWFATVNVWNVEVEGEYARFEVRSNMGTPKTASATTYVREDRAVELEIAGESRNLGSVEAIEFSGRSALVVVVPPGGIGVGDRDDEDPECSPTWPVTGDVAAGTIECGDGAKEDNFDGKKPSDGTENTVSLVGGGEKWR